MNRRSFITGLVGLVAAPAIVKAELLMPLRGIVMPLYGVGPMMTATEVRWRRWQQDVFYGFDLRDLDWPLRLDRLMEMEMEMEDALIPPPPAQSSPAPAASPGPASSSR